MKKQVKVSGVLVCLLVLTLVLALYYGLVYTDLSKKTAALSAQHITDAQQLSEYRELEADEPSIRKSIEDLKTRTKASAAELGVAPSGLRADLEKGLASVKVTATGITMSDASAGKKTSSGRILTQVAITVTADCSQAQLSALLHYFEQVTEAVYSIDGVSVNRKDAQGQAAGGQLTVTLNMTAYYLAAASSGAGP